jgi:uncharacterized protein YggE
MKYIFCLMFSLALSPIMVAQVYGNSNYQTRVHYDDSNLRASSDNGSDITISAKGLANIKADAFVAVFSISQIANTPEEVYKLMDSRISAAEEKLGTLSSEEKLKVHSDMISFIALYAFEKETKIFSRDSYIEIPAGFELKKNLHIEYQDPEQLREISLILSQSEIFDLVRVDYFSKDLEKVKTQLMDRALLKLGEKKAKIEKLLNLKLDTLNQNMTDAYRVVYPVERYQSYQKYSASSQYSAKAGPTVGQSNTVYYQPIIDKEFDFVVNPLVVEPVIQVLYEIIVKVDEASFGRRQREQLMLTPQGQLLPLKRP